MFWSILIKVPNCNSFLKSENFGFSWIGPPDHDHRPWPMSSKMLVFGRFFQSCLNYSGTTKVWITIAFFRVFLDFLVGGAQFFPNQEAFSRLFPLWETRSYLEIRSFCPGEPKLAWVSQIRYIRYIRQVRQALFWGFWTKSSTYERTESPGAVEECF